MSKSDNALGRFFEYRAATLQSIVDATRDVISHALSKGVEAETTLAEMLASFLPAKFDARKGFLLDSSGKQSHEVDLVIVDRQQIARMFDFRSFELVPIEAASAGVEVKTTLTKAELEDTFRRFQEIQDMHFVEERFVFTQTRASEAGLYAGSTTRPELALFAYDASVSMEAVKAVYDKHPSLAHVKVCILQKGIIANIADSDAGPLGLRWIQPREANGNAFAGAVLTLFLYQLFLPAVMEQRKGSDFYRHYLRGESVFKEVK